MSNRLAKETSPYLLEHAENPVDWYSWGTEALEKAHQENKPILLSIGYAACHWCHVMAEESFMDNETALLMNQWFINIKVDREERPDLDKIYQTAHQLLTGRGGGWPLTVFLTADKQIPFYAGTYFPVEESFGRPGFKTLLTETAHFYYQRRDAIDRLTKNLMMAFEKISEASANGVILDETPLKLAREELSASFDFVHGGFGRAPKFPLATHLNSLLEAFYFSKGEDREAKEMLAQALTKMAQGGLYDQLGGGFFRYSVDSHWIIPHFEKMLYDNAQLISVYAEFFLLTQENLFKKIVTETIQWALREMRAPEGGFYSSLNADSEGIEGKYYYWDRDELRQILTPFEYSAIVDYFGLKRPPNFEGHWHLYIAYDDKTIHEEWIAAAKEKLFAAREQRIRPSCDKKILTSWNALLIKALVKSAMIFNREDWADAAQQAINFIIENLWKNQRLLAVSTHGQSRMPAYLDDYAFLLAAILDFLQIRWSQEYLQWAQVLADQLLKYFYDTDNGGFFYTAIDHETLIQRPKIFSDEALPSGNGVAVCSLLRLGFLLGESKYLAAAEKTLQASWGEIKLRPSAQDSLLTGLRSYFHPPKIIILRGEKSLMPLWRQEFAKYYLPSHYCYDLDRDLPIPEQGVQAYICQGTECLEPINNLTEFVAYLKNFVDP